MGWAEAVGYLASVLIAVSLMMSSLVRLRWLNLAGAAVFTVYGTAIGAWPVAAVNAFICGVNVWHLRRLARGGDDVDLLEAAGPDDPLVARVLAAHADEIARLFPGWRDELPADARAAVILRDLAPAAVVIWSEQGADVRLHVDYARPAWRDLACGRDFLARMAPQWRAEGRRRVISAAGDRAHRGYLKRLGFRPRGEGGWFVLPLDHLMAGRSPIRGGPEMR